MSRLVLHVRTPFAKAEQGSLFGPIKNNPELEKKRLVDKRGRTTTRYVRRDPPRTPLFAGEHHRALRRLLEPEALLAKLHEGARHAHDPQAHDAFWREVHAEAAGESTAPAEPEPEPAPEPRYPGQPAWQAAEERPERILYHGTSAPPFARFAPGVAYLAPNEAEASLYARNDVLGGGRGRGERRVLTVTAAPGRARDISSVVEEALLADEDLDEVLEREAEKARNRDYRYLEFTHPGARGEDFTATVALYPEEDLRLEPSEAGEGLETRLAARGLDLPHAQALVRLEQLALPLLDSVPRGHREAALDRAHEYLVRTGLSVKEAREAMEYGRREGFATLHATAETRLGPLKDEVEATLERGDWHGEPPHRTRPGTPGAGDRGVPRGARDRGNARDRLRALAERGALSRITALLLAHTAEHDGWTEAFTTALADALEALPPSARAWLDEALADGRVLPFKHHRDREGLPPLLVHAFDYAGAACVRFRDHPPRIDFFADKLPTTKNLLHETVHAARDELFAAGGDVATLIEEVIDDTAALGTAIVKASESLTIIDDHDAGRERTSVYAESDRVVNDLARLAGLVERGEHEGALNVLLIELQRRLARAAPALADLAVRGGRDVPSYASDERQRLAYGLYHAYAKRLGVDLPHVHAVEEPLAYRSMRDDDFAERLFASLAAARANRPAATPEPAPDPRPGQRPLTDATRAYLDRLLVAKHRAYAEAYARGIPIPQGDISDERAAKIRARVDRYQAPTKLAS